jgi:hypothetical protein
VLLTWPLPCTLTVTLKTLRCLKLTTIGALSVTSVRVLRLTTNISKFAGSVSANGARTYIK